MAAENPTTYASAQLCFNITKTEYDYELNRSSKLDSPHIQYNTSL